MNDLDERTKAILRFLFRLLRTAVGAIVATANTSDANWYKRPWVWFGVFMAVEPLFTELLSPAKPANFQVAAQMDERIEARAEEKASTMADEKVTSQIRSLIAQGAIDRRQSPRS